MDPRKLLWFLTIAVTLLTKMPYHIRSGLMDEDATNHIKIITERRKHPQLVKELEGNPEISDERLVKSANSR